jgi:hypothetical protein
MWFNGSNAIDKFTKTITIVVVALVESSLGLQQDGVVGKHKKLVENCFSYKKP